MRNRIQNFISLSPFFYLLGMIFLSRQIFSGDPLYGSHQFALVSAGFLLVLQRIRREHSVRAFLLAFQKNLTAVLPAMEILFFVGMLIGAWAVAGVLGSMIRIGVAILHPSFFLPGVCLAAGFASVISGSSWTTAGTLGVALMGIGKILGIPEGICAGAVVSGCYFGDKLSPLSDTTNLASSLTSVPLQTHIAHMAKTTIPSYVVSLILFAIWNVSFLDAGGDDSILETSSILSRLHQLPFSYLDLLPVLFVFGSSLFGMKARYSLILGIVSGMVLAFWKSVSLFDFSFALLFGFQAHTGNESLNSFLSGGGISAILPTEFLILAAVWFGGALEGLGYLNEILLSIKVWVKTKWDVLLTTMGTSFFLNLTTADQYLSLVIPARAFRHLADVFHLEPKEVSRALEDSGTISSPLVPWNSCGAFMATSLNVATLVYLPYVWFNILHIFLSIALVIRKRKKEISV